MATAKRICLWSGPRNISTAFMYAFAQRTDVKVFDEPLYGYYLKQHPEARKYHPDATLIQKVMENDGEKVVNMMLSNNEKPVLFFKNMTHHLLGLDKGFTKQTVNLVLTRHPLDMLPSFAKVIPKPSLSDVGYALSMDLVNYFIENKIPFVVIDAKKVLENPNRQLQQICDFAQIPFDHNMLSWQPQQLIEDGIWAKHWYTNVHKSNGFQKYKPKTEQFPKSLKPLLDQCLPYYDKLRTYTI